MKKIINRVFDWANEESDFERGLRLLSNSPLGPPSRVIYSISDFPGILSENIRLFIRRLSGTDERIIEWRKNNPRNYHKVPKS